MKFIKKWDDYLKEAFAKNSEIKKKREEIQSKIHKIESDLKHLKEPEIDATVIDTDAGLNVPELEMSLESLKIELGKLDENA